VSSRTDFFAKWRQGMRRPSRWPCRCASCGQRVTKRLAPDEYRKPPKCPSGCRKRRAGRVVEGFAELRVDFYRILKEWGAPACNCGEYSFPHARGRGYCTHNAKLTAEDYQARAEEGRWA